nr:TetR family transcriptional regulator [Streptomyces sp. ODS25]
MTSAPLTAERILEATEEVLRRHGPSKATVVDVARALGVSHGSVYRHFGTKAELREAVTKRWLDRTMVKMQRIVDRTEPSATQTLRDWLGTLFDLKRRAAGADPELFETYLVLLGESSTVVAGHITELVGQLTTIVERGVARGEFTLLPGGVTVTARAILDGSARFHNPAHAPEWTDPDIDDECAAVTELLIRALVPGGR